MAKFKPDLRTDERQGEAAVRRTDASQTEHATKAPLETPVNADEATYGEEGYPSNFTKGLPHDANGLVSDGYHQFVDAINCRNPNPHKQVNFEGIPTGGGLISAPLDADSSTHASWRGWESPRTGHYFDLQGPDADAVGMAPAPALGAPELTAEMAEVYAMAILRDVPFSKIEAGTGSDPATGISTEDVIHAFKQIPYFCDVDDDPDARSRRRQLARFLDPDGGYDVEQGTTAGDLPTLTGKLLFRGSGPGAKAGPWVSQFMMQGNAFGDVRPENGKVSYGSQIIDQKTRSFVPGLDYMTNWGEWMDVQNGADFRGLHTFRPETRFITTPRDIATYVRFDALYQAYLNACLILLGTSSVKTQSGFPDQNNLARTGFASFGGPHVLSLVTEVATRCLKFARRQKFNWHRRARPEKVSGLLSVGVTDGTKVSLGNATQAVVDQMLDELGPLAHLVHQHNTERETNNRGRRGMQGEQADWITGKNLLLAMAFPEGSPMHPAYAAGHATVAGGCVTMLKAFFRTLDKNHQPIAWDGLDLPVVEASEDGSSLADVPPARAEDMTLEGELNKLAANISIARNMAGVHYYSDYYDSLRMGERVAVGILIEQMRSYDEKVEIKFRSFDGDLIKISTKHPDGAEVNGSVDNYLDWVARPQTAVPPANLVASAKAQNKENA